MQDHGHDRSGALGEFWRSSRQLLPEFQNRSQIWSHLPPERRYPEQFLLIFTGLSKGSEGSRRTPCDGAVVAAAFERLQLQPACHLRLRRCELARKLLVLGLERRDLLREHRALVF